MDHYDYLEKAFELMKKSRYKDAIKYCDKSIKLKPNDQNNWNIKACALDVLQRYDEAIKCFDEAIRLNPDDYTVWRNKVICLLGQSKFEESIPCLEEVLRLEPEDEFMWFDKALALEQLDRFDEARICYDNSYKIKKNEKVGKIEPKLDALEVALQPDRLECYDCDILLGYFHYAKEPELDLDYTSVEKSFRGIYNCKKCMKQRVEDVKPHRFSSLELQCELCHITLGKLFKANEPEHSVEGSYLHIGQDIPQIFHCDSCSTKEGRNFENDPYSIDAD